MVDRQTIYLVGFPKSGCTWATRLLADILNSPSGGCMSSEDTKEVATEGQNRPGPYIVRKGHFVLIDDNGVGLVVPRPHRLAWRRLTAEKVIFLIRDPRDICISGAYHWRQKPEVFLDRMIAGDVAKCGRWDRYCNDWVDAGSGIRFAYPIRYEDLLEFTYTFLGIIFNALDFDFELYISRARDAIQRQSFVVRKAQIGDNEQELRRNNLRKGIMGDWHNHFTPAMNDKIWAEFGWMMKKLGYDRDNVK